MPLYYIQDVPQPSGRELGSCRLPLVHPCKDRVVLQMPGSLRYQPTQRGGLRADRSSALCFNTNPHKPHIF